MFSQQVAVLVEALQLADAWHSSPAKDYLSWSSAGSQLCCKQKSSGLAHTTWISYLRSAGWLCTGAD